MRPLTIVQVCADRGIAPGSTKGAAQHLRGIAAGFHRAGHQVTTYSLRKAEGAHPVEVRRLGELSPNVVAEADLVYERYSLGHTTVLDQCRRANTPFVLEVNAPLVSEAAVHRGVEPTPELVTTETTLLQNADLVVTVSTELTQWVNTYRDGPIVTIPNGFEPDWFNAPSSPTGVPSLVFIGHPKPWHGADRLVGLLGALAARGLHPQLTIIGGGPGADAIQAQARASGLGNQVHVTGALVPQKASALLATATVGLAPYPRQESFYFCPLKIIDYLAAGLAIVSTDQGDIASLVGDAGTVVDPDDDEGFTDAVAALLADPELVAELGANGRRRAMQTMSWERAAARTLDAIVSTGPFHASA